MKRIKRETHSCDSLGITLHFIHGGNLKWKAKLYENEEENQADINS